MNVDRPARQIRLPWKNREAILPNEDETMVSRRIPFLGHLPLSIKNHFIAMMGEFAGTFLFLLFALGGTNVVNAAPEQGQPESLAANPAKLLFISLCFGMSLAVNAWVFFRISGGLFNPAVSQPTRFILPAKLTYLTGHSWYDACWSNALCERLPCHHFTNSRRHRFICCCIVSVARTPQRTHISGWRHICDAGSVY